MIPEWELKCWLTFWNSLWNHRRLWRTIKTKGCYAHSTVLVNPKGIRTQIHLAREFDIALVSFSSEFLHQLHFLICFYVLCFIIRPVCCFETNEKVKRCETLSHFLICLKAIDRPYNRRSLLYDYFTSLLPLHCDENILLTTYNWNHSPCLSVTHKAPVICLSKKGGEWFDELSDRGDWQILF